MKKLLTALALASCTPAYAEPVYGPPDDFAAQEAERVRNQAERNASDLERLITMDAKLLNDLRRDATRWEIVYLVLNVIDAAQTIDCLKRNVCQEANPLFGKNPSAGKLIGVKAAGGVVHWLLFSHFRKTNPQFARRFAQLSVVIQGGVVAANARFTF